MPEFDFSGEFISVNNVVKGDLLTINATPYAEEKESPTKKEMVNGVLKPKKYMVLNIPVSLNKVNKIYSPDAKTGMAFQQAWGKDYSQWQNKQFSVDIEDYKSFGVDKKRVIGKPLVAEKV